MDEPTGVQVEAESQCETTRRCVDRSYVCDGQLDCCGDDMDIIGSGEGELANCTDKSDEDNCGMLFYKFTVSI